MTMNWIKNKTKRIYTGIKNDVRASHDEVNVINMSGSRNYDGKIFHSNWGDDINWYFLREISVKPIIIQSDLCFIRNSVTNYLCIGSILGLIDNEKSIVWGAGILDAKRSKDIKAREFKAVRGPLTRQILLNMGIKCPEIYGDPALLIPRIYSPKQPKTHKLGIIPHYATIKEFERFIDEPSVKVIHTRNYSSWLRFIDEIRSCECIVSMSLHGLIIAEAYGIPCRWVESTKFDTYSHFKYLDFYTSIGKANEHPLKITPQITISGLTESTKDWIPGKIDLEPLVKACPFEISL